MRRSGGEAHKNRKTRSDKTTEIRSTILATDCEMISMLAFICGKPIKDVVQALVLEGLASADIERAVSAYFCRPITLTNAAYFGNARGSAYKPMFGSPTERPSGRYLAPVIDILDGYAFALKCSRSAAHGLVLTTTLHSRKHVLRLVTKSAAAELTPDRRRTLATLLRAIEAENDAGFHISVSALVAYLAEECANSLVTVKDAVGRYLGAPVAEETQEPRYQSVDTRRYPLQNEFRVSLPSLSKGER
jgi:hypothetical protein